MSESKPNYKRVLLKLSGEALADKEGGAILSEETVGKICAQIKKCSDAGVQIAIVVGAGNIWRGKMGAATMERSLADSMGMLATTINALAIGDQLRRAGADARVMTPIEMPKIAETFVRDKAVSHLEKGRVVVFAGGTGCPFFSTDTAAVLKACEIGADTVLMAKNIDAIYTASPSADPNAKKLSETTYSYILDHKLGVIDLTAAALALENKMPLHVFGLKDTENISRVLLSDEKTGTVVAAE